MFPELPTIEDFELQLERSLESLEEGAPNVIFDRCPADILGYLLVHSDVDVFDLDSWLPRVRAAIGTIDLIVFLPVEEPDRIVLPSSQDAEYRQLVDEKLKEIVLEDPLGLDVDVVEVSGSPRTRSDRALAAIRNAGG